jgi:PIN domain nuclease of toxin-antitoxin system
MSLILDTHSFLWCIMGSPRLIGDAQALLEEDAHAKGRSTAGLREMAMTLSLGRLTRAEPFGVLMPQQLRISSIALVSIEIARLAVLTTLPFHPRDLFARLFITQAVVERCPVVGIDPGFDAYPVQRLW